MSVLENLARIKAQLPKHVKLVAISKRQSVDKIQEAYSLGQRDFGENMVQELDIKQKELPGDIRWHMVGHLQRNKVKYLAEYIHLIHGVDSQRLLKEINKQGKKVNRVIPCLLQVHIAAESTKFGFAPEELMDHLGNGDFLEFEHVNIQGLMGMATNTENESQVAGEFKSLHRLFEKVKNQIDQANVHMEILSMGMSSDFEIAIENGSNLVRVGSSIFGDRKI